MCRKHRAFAVLRGLAYAILWEIVAFAIIYFILMHSSYAHQ